MASQNPMSTVYSRSSPAFDFACGGSAAPLAKELREQIRESAPTRCGSLTATRGLPGLRQNVRKVKAAEVEPPGAGAGSRSRVGAGLRVETELVVHLPFLTIAEDAIGFLDVLEAVFGGPVPRVHIGVMLAGEPAVSLADLIVAGLALDAKNPIVVFLFRRGHRHHPINLSTKASRAKRYPLGRTHRYLSGASSHSDDGGSSGPIGLPPWKSNVFPSPLGFIIDVDKLGVDDIVFIFLVTSRVACTRAIR